MADAEADNQTGDQNEEAFSCDDGACCAGGGFGRRGRLAGGLQGTRARGRPACAQFGGFYIGANAGWGYYDHRRNDRDAWTSENSDDLQRSSVNYSNSGFVGGVQGGYNWQSGCTLFGVELDYAWGKINNDTLETDGDVGVNTDSLRQSRLRGLGSLRTRAGVVVDNLLIYVTGGLAFANFSRTYTQTDQRPQSEVFSTAARAGAGRPASARNGRSPPTGASRAKWFIIASRKTMRPSPARCSAALRKASASTTRTGVGHPRRHQLSVRRRPGLLMPERS